MKIISGVATAVFIAVVGFGLGHTLGAAGVQAEFDEAQRAWDAERQTATDRALAESETQRTIERAFVDQLTAALKEYDDEKTALTAAARADRERYDRRLRDIRADITSALNRQEWPAAPTCVRAADATLTALGACADRYRGVAHQYGECLAGMQMIEKTYNAARDVCR